MTIDPRTNSNSSEKAASDVFGGERKIWVGSQILISKNLRSAVGWESKDALIYTESKILISVISYIINI